MDAKPRSSLAITMQRQLPPSEETELLPALICSLASAPSALVQMAALSEVQGRHHRAGLAHRLPADHAAADAAWQLWTRWSSAQLPGEAQAAAVGEWFSARGGWLALCATLRENNVQTLAAWCLQVVRSAPPELGPQPIRLLNRLTEQVRQFLPEVQGKARKARKARLARGAELLEDDNELALRKQPYRKQAESIFHTIQAQQRAILQALAHQQFARAVDFLNDLIRYHLENGGQRYLIKSLSNLAARARRRRALRFAQHCSDLAIRHAPCDPVTRNGRAEVLKAQGRLPEALAAYEQVIAESPGNVVSLSGRAEVLKAQGRLAEALAAYEQILVQFPNNVVARNGRASVLKAQGRLCESLAVYEQLIAEFPTNASARNGRAEVLKAQGRRAEACAAYEQNILDFPENVMARNGRAEVLKAQGKLGEALAAYDQIQLSFPDDTVSINGRAGVLKAQRKRAPVHGCH